MRRSRTTLTAIAAATLVAACSSSDKSASTSDSAKPAGASASAASDAATGAANASSSSASPNVVMVHAKDFAFTMPDSIPAGMTTFELMNEGPSLHHMQIVRLDSNKTAEQFASAMKNPGPPPRWAMFVGGPNAPDPSSESNATMDMQPGQYAVICFVDIPGGVPHFAKGMVHPLTVTENPKANHTAPTADNTITLSDYAFAFSKPLTSGKHTFEVRTNAGGQPHEIELVKLAPGKTQKDLVAWLDKPNGPPPGNAIGGTAMSVPGAATYFTADVTPGDYVAICFVPDMKDGKPHYAHGMVQTVKVS